MSEEFSGEEATEEAGREGSESVAAAAEAVEVGIQVAEAQRNAVEQSEQIRKNIQAEGEKQMAAADSKALGPIIEGAGGGEVPEPEIREAVDILNTEIDSSTSPMDALEKGEVAKNGKSGGTLKKMGNVLKGYAESISDNFKKLVLQDGGGKLDPEKQNAVDALDKLEKQSLNEFTDKLEEYNKETDKNKKQQLKIEADQKLNEYKEYADQKSNIDKIPEITKERLEAKGEKSSKVIELLIKYRTLITLATGVGMVFLVLKLISDELSGCYQYKGTSSKKIPKPKDKKHTEWCSCGPDNVVVPPNVGNTVELSKICTGDMVHYPFCANGLNPLYPTCSSDSPGQKGAIFYNYEKFTPASIISNIPDYANDILDDLIGDLDKLLSQMLKWGLILAGIMILLYIAFVIGKKMLDKKKESSV